MPIGYWESEHLLAPADLTVIGAGIVGMSTALHYKAQHPHERVRIIERDVLGEGGTTRNAGFACFGGPGEWLEDLETLGRSKWLELIRMRAEGLRALIELLGEEALGMEWSGGWELFAPSPTGLKRSREAGASLATLNEAVQPLMVSILGHLAPHPLDTPALAPRPWPSSLGPRPLALALAPWPSRSPPALFLAPLLKGCTPRSRSSF